jgi:hypothetical protein
MFHDDDESIFGMLKDYAKQIIGILLFVLFITVLSNLGNIQSWIEGLFSQ